MTWLRLLRLARRARRLLAAAMCGCDIHDLPEGFTRVAPAEPMPSLPISYGDGPVWDVGCRWCYRRFTAIADARHAPLVAGLKRGMRRHRAANDLRAPRGADRRPS